MSYQERLRQRARECSHLLCLGLDPDLDRLNMGQAQAAEYIERLLESVQPAAIKPNSAYFEALGTSGWIWLEQLVRRWRGRVPIILDVKRGDIGPSSLAYAKAAFERLGVDAVTVNPWMGRDSLAPFARYSPERGLYALVRTSNPGHADLQQLPVEGRPLWQHLLLQLPEWAGGTGAVVGATGPEDLRWACQNLAPDMPLLIPGVGNQGGSAEQVMAALRQGDLELHRVNVSSKILYAFEDYPELSPLEAAQQAFHHYARELAIRAGS